MATIQPLSKLDIPKFRALASGYVSDEKYEITRQEDDGQTTLTMTLQPLETPYEKRWELDEETLMYYQAVVQKGLSVGLYEDDDLVGIVIAEKNDWNRTLWVWEFHIHPDRRGKGYGRQLMEALTEVGRQNDCRIIVCEAQNTNVPAIRFYRKVGFAVDGIDLSYYTNRDVEAGEVAIFMKRKIE